MGTVAALTVAINGTTRGLEQSLLQSKRMLDTFDRQASAPVKAARTASSPASELGKAATPKPAQVSLGGAEGIAAAAESASINFERIDALAQHAADTLKNAGYDFKAAAAAFSAQLTRASIDAVKRLAAVKIGSGKTNLMESLLRGALKYSEQVGAAKVQWAMVRDSLLAAGKSQEEAIQGANQQASYAMSNVAPLATKLKAAFEVYKERAESTMKSIGGIGKWLQSTAQAAADKFAAIDFSKLRGKLGSMGGAAAGPLGNLSSGLQRALPVVGRIGIAFAGVAAAVGVVVGGVMVVQAVVSKVGSLVAGIIGSAVNVIGGIFGAVSSVFGVIGSGVASLVKGLGDALGAVGRLAAAVGKGLLAPFIWLGGKISGIFSAAFDYVMGWLGKIKSFIGGVLESVVGSVLGRLTLTAGVLGVMAANLRVTARGGQQVQYNDSGEEIEQSGLLEQVFARAEASVTKLTQTIQRVVGKWFTMFSGGGSSLVDTLAKYLSVAIDWVTSKVEMIAVGLLNTAAYIVSIIDSVVGVVRAVFKGDWFGAAAMGLEVGARIVDGIAIILRMIAPYLDTILKHLAGWASQTLKLLLNTMGEVEATLHQVAATVIRGVMYAVEMVVDGAAIAAGAALGGIDRLRDAFPTFSGKTAFLDQDKPSTLANDAMSAMYTPFLELKTTMGKVTRGLESGRFGTPVTGWAKELAEMLKSLSVSTASPSNDAAASLEKTAASMRATATSIAPNAVATYSGTLQPVQQVIADLKKAIGQGQVVAQQGKVIDPRLAGVDSERDSGMNAAAVDTALGQVKLAGAMSRRDGIAQKGLTEAQKQTKILESMNQLLGVSDTANYVQVKDSAGNDVSMLRDFTKMVTRQTADGKTVTQREAMSAEEIKGVENAAKALAASALTGGGDVGKIDTKLLSDDAIRRAYELAGKQTEKAIAQMTMESTANGQAQREAQLTANRWLERISKNTSSGLVPLT